MKAPRSQGNVLLTTVLMLTVLSALVGMTLTVSGTSSQNTRRSRTYTEAVAAAEGALEYAYGVWLKRVVNHNDKLTTNEANAGLSGTTGDVPVINGFSNKKGEIQIRVDALDEYGVAMASGTAIPPGVVGRVPGYEGWSGQTFTYAAQATVKMDGNATIGVRRLFQYTQVPLFQSMFFFEHDLELYKPAEMIIKGLIHTNSTVYFATDVDGNIKIVDYVSHIQGLKEVAPTGPLWSRIDPADVRISWFWDGGKWVKPSDSGYAAEKERHVHQVARIEPMGSSPEQAFQDKTNPNVTGEFHELIEPPVPGHNDPPAVADRRLISKAGLIINVDGTDFAPNPVFTSSYDSIAKATTYTSPTSSVTITVPDRNGVTLTNAGAAAIASAIGKTKGTPSYKVVTSSTTTDRWGRPVVTSSTTTHPATGLYDARQETYVDTLDVNIAAIKNVIEPSIGTSPVGNFNGVLYLYDTTQDVQNPVSNIPSINTVRLTNGSVLPDTGLTVASLNPVYVQGDYNTGGTGTAVKSNATGNPNNTDSPTTVNSSGTPTYTPRPAAVIADAVMLLSSAWKDSNSAKSVSGRAAVNTTYNMAILAGFMPSTSTHYSGGANNFPRYLESWSGRTCTYWGSMVELFPSKVFTGQWDTAGIYDPPKRCWNFDTRFLTNPPPGSVDAIILTRGPWSRF